MSKPLVILSFDFLVVRGNMHLKICHTSVAENCREL